MKSFLVLISLAALSGCASFVNGTRQDISILSSPTNAAVTIDGQSKGQTPLVCSLSRKDIHVIRIEMPGYQPFELSTTRKVSGWVWGNLIFGGLIGLAIDTADGSIYKVSPEQVRTDLNKQTVQRREPGDVCIVAVLKADPSWNRIAQMASVVR